MGMFLEGNIEVIEQPEFVFAVYDMIKQKKLWSK